LNDYAKKNKLPYTIIRPAAIYGLGDRRLFKLFKMALKPYSLFGEMEKSNQGAER
jgi:dihydroflavonol-4-reductase